MGAKDSKTAKALAPGDRARHYGAPWLVTLAAMPAAGITHAVWGGDPVMQDAVAGAAVVLTGTVYATWKKRHEHTRTLATWVAGAVTGWVALATSVSPVSPGMLKAWELGVPVLSLMWNLRDMGHAPARDTDKVSGKGDSVFNKIGGALSGARVRDTREKPGRVELDVQLSPGQSGDAVQQEKAALASRAKVGQGQVTVSPDRDRADRVTIAFQDSPDQRKALRNYVPGTLGRSIADAALEFGTRSDGVPLAIWIVGNEDMDNPRPLGHTLCTGMTGSGKTQTLKNIITRIRETRDCVPVVADPVKFSQSFGDIADALEIAAKGPQQTRQLILNLKEAVTYRAEEMGRLGFDQWVPECWTDHGIPAVFVDIEEAASVLSDDDGEFDEVIRTARSVGIHLCASMQSAHHQNMDRKTRGQFSQSLCHGVKELIDARFALNSNTLEAGADPVKWQNNYPGSLYAELVWTPPEQWSTEARAHGVTRAERRQYLDESRPTWGRLDAGTAARLGRGILVPDAKVTAGLPRVADGVPQPPWADDWTAEQELAAALVVGEQLLDALSEQPLDLTRVTTDEGDVIDVTQPLAPPTGAPLLLVPLASKMEPEDAYRLVKERVNELERAGTDTVTFREVADIQVASGLSRATFYNLLERLEENGRLEKATGKGVAYLIREKVLNGSPVG
jgi:hypothetical protein